MDNLANSTYSKNYNKNEKVNQNLCQVRQILLRQKNAKNTRKPTFCQLPDIPPPIIRCPGDLRKQDEFIMRIRKMEIEFPESRFCVVRPPTKKSETIYTPITNNSTSSQESELPLKFYSTDGKMKMLLTKNPDNQKRAQKLEFPTIPEQLRSSKINNCRRNKFNAVLNLGQMSMDISGIFSGGKLIGENVEKLVINGTSFAVGKQ